jgi:hypothetical protein
MKIIWNGLNHVLNISNKAVNHDWQGFFQVQNQSKFSRKSSFKNDANKAKRNYILVSLFGGDAAFVGQRSSSLLPIGIIPHHFQFSLQNTRNYY